MKNFRIIISIVVIACSVIAFIFFPVNVHSQKKALTESANPMPDSILSILKISCMPCHSSSSSSSAKNFLNLSNWDKFSEKKQLKIANAMCKKLTKDKMPPSSFREKKPEAAPTKEQMNSICSWASSLNVIK